jgi:hypothetical protein
MTDKKKNSPQVDNEVNPIFELYSLLKDADDERYSDEEIRERLKQLKERLKILFSATPPTQK